MKPIKFKTDSPLSKKTNVLLCIAILVFTFIQKSSAQDLHFSQFYESPLTLNPALCGQFKGTLYAEANYRTQWSSVMGSGNGYNTLCATLEFRNLLKNWTKGFISEGLSFFSDKSGDAQIITAEICFTAASGIYLNANNTLTAGLQAGWAQRSVNFSAMQWGEQYVNGSYSENAPTGESGIGTSFSYMDFAGGLCYNYSAGQVRTISNNEVKANLGVSFYHFNQPNISFYGENTPGSLLYMRTDIHGYLQFGIQHTHISIIPAAAYYMQGPSSEIDAGMKFRYYMIQNESAYEKSEKGGTSFDIGAYYRVNDALIFLLGLKLKSYTVGFNYDINISQLHVVSSGRGALEVSLKYIY
jgi:type IX secretion system PorP/SprF family membrane protein